MNELLTHEGGQPLFLDDLKQIQDSALGAIALLLMGMTGRNGGYLLNPYEPTIETEGGVTTYSMADNAVIYEGRIIPFVGSEWTNEDGVMYVCVKESEVDIRTFEDGQQRACQKKRDAYLSTDVEGAAWHGMVSTLPCLLELLTRRTGQESEAFDWIELQEGQVTFKNGYHGRLMYSREAPLRLKIDVQTEQKAWDGEFEGDVRHRCAVAVIDDASLLQMLRGMETLDGVISPCTPNGNLLWPGGCKIQIDNDGYICLYVGAQDGFGHYTWGTPGTTGFADVPPCGANDDYATIQATLTI